ncbi:MAG: Nif3-like dinuclear metal center hexameric protein [Nocardioides sp.]
MPDSAMPDPAGTSAGGESNGVALGELLHQLDEWYPPHTAAQWDAVGLVWGDLAAPVAKVMFAVDPAPAVVAEAVAWGADLVVVHHPLFLKPVHSMAGTTPKGRIVAALANARCALFTAHTNADEAIGGVSESLALALGLDELRPIVPTVGDLLPGAIRSADTDGIGPAHVGTGRIGTGRIGTVTPTILSQFAETVAAALPATAGGVRVAGARDRLVHRVAVCGGSGDFLLDQLISEDVDVYLTSDLRHHRAAEFLDHEGPALIDVAHWAAEWTWLPVVAARLSAAFEERVATRVSLTPTDPWTFRI